MIIIAFRSILCSLFTFRTLLLIYLCSFHTFAYSIEWIDISRKTQTEVKYGKTIGKPRKCWKTKPLATCLFSS
uniref:Uncharacterized protein n=1 Tax=Candidatus Methanomethylicus mesodigestus TaxID=1867258 RepID=A0A7C3FAZ6_9CREN